MVLSDCNPSMLQLAWRNVQIQQPASVAARCRVEAFGWGIGHYWPSEKFDVVIASDVLYGGHCSSRTCPEELERFVALLHHCVAPDGIAIIGHVERNCMARDDLCAALELRFSVSVLRAEQCVSDALLGQAGNAGVRSSRVLLATRSGSERGAAKASAASGATQNSVPPVAVASSLAAGPAAAAAAAPHTKGTDGSSKFDITDMSYEEYLEGANSSTEGLPPPPLPSGLPPPPPPPAPQSPPRRPSAAQQRQGEQRQREQRQGEQRQGEMRGVKRRERRGRSGSRGERRGQSGSRGPTHEGYDHPTHQDVSMARVCQMDVHRLRWLEEQILGGSAPRRPP